MNSNKPEDERVSWSGRIRRFERDIWNWELARFDRSKRFLITQLRIYLLVLKGWRNERLNLRAAALTYITIFSLVPVLAIVFAVFEAFGGLRQLKEEFLPRLMQQLTVGSPEVVQGAIEDFIRNVHSGAVGGLGTIILFFSVVVLLGSMERAFNDIWGLDRGRTVFQRFAVYWTVVTVAPVLLALALVLRRDVQRLELIRNLFHQVGLSQGFTNAVLSFVLVWLAFALINAFMPNTRVRPVPALAGGFISAVLALTAVWGFHFYASRALEASRIYGALSAVPVFLAWLYLNWLIILFGAQVASATQNVAAYQKAMHQARGKGGDIVSTKEIIQVSGAPAAIGPYSQAVAVDGWIYCSGQIALDPATGQLVQGNVAEETRRVLDNLKAVLEGAGCGMSEVVKTTVFLKDLADYAQVNEVYASYFPKSPPARAAVQVAALPKGVRVEIDCVARKA